MNVLICDDDLKIVQQIKNFLLKLSKQSTYNFDITCFSNGDSILDKQIKTDFAFIDIEMPGVNGLSVTKHLQTLNPNIIVFIVTSFQGYLDDAMDLKVFRFLSKPIDENRFFRSMEIALNLYKQSTEKIILDYFDECHNIFTIDILYLTIENRKTKLVTKTQEFISNKKFDYWKKQLSKFTEILGIKKTKKNNAHIFCERYCCDIDFRYKMRHREERFFCYPQNQSFWQRA